MSIERNGGDPLGLDNDNVSVSCPLNGADEDECFVHSAGYDLSPESVSADIIVETKTPTGQSFRGAFFNHEIFTKIIMFKEREKKNKGFIALVSVLILSAVLALIMFSNSTSSFFASFDALGSEFKRVSLGLSESCVNKALLNIAQDYEYEPEDDGDTVVIEEDKYECIIESIEYTALLDEDDEPIDLDIKKLATIKTKAQYPLQNGSWTTSQVTATIYNPIVAITSQPPTCSFEAVGATENTLTITEGEEVTFAWAISENGGVSSFVIERQLSGGELEEVYLDEEDPFLDTFVDSPLVSATYTATITGPGGSTQCQSPQQILVESVPSCADTLMMLDRTGSMSNDSCPGCLIDERDAAFGLLDLYKDILPEPPQMAVGHFGISQFNHYGQVLNYGQLTIDYGTNDGEADGDLYHAVEVATTLPLPWGTFTNLDSAIDVGNSELNSERHIPGREKVLILISDGHPNRPCPECTPFEDPEDNTYAKEQATQAANDAKATGTIIFTIHFGYEGPGNADQDFLASLATDSPENDVNPSIENNDEDHFFIAPTSADMPAVFDAVGKLACPAAEAPESGGEPLAPPPPPPPPLPIDINSWTEVIDLD